ncbi:hypothetical protein AMTR_s00016p00253560 [Amborella trichopoda]|uniref:Desiccation-related protein PCC13-62 n=1 Tax=Amborella trichopoda TaxID=13333 RepID=W1PH19_AMBTC|nr:hypothetical protein AMTR_s00016p00253560 [Amborella trichopoda]
MNSCEQDLLEFSLNLEFLEAEFFLYGALGYGIDAISPALANGGVAPTGVKKANLSPITRDIMIQFGYQELGHLRAIQNITGGGIPRPPMDLSSSHFATLMERAMGVPLIPPFDPYIDELNFLLSAYMLPIVGLTGYVADFNYINTSKTTTVARLGRAIDQVGPRLAPKT